MVYFENNANVDSVSNIDFKDSYSILPVLCKVYDVHFMYDEQYLNNKFHLENKYFSLHGFSFMGKIPNIKGLKNKWNHEIDNVDVRTQLAMYCNEFHFSKRQFESMMSFRNNNLYDLTHAAFQLYFIETNQCLKIEKINQFKSVLLTELKKAWTLKEWEHDEKYAQFSLDLTLEIQCAILLLSEEVDFVNIQYLLQKQLPDGGFSLNDFSKKPSLHASIIAFWTLNHALKILKG
jgi:hypothetical protein